MGWPMQFPKYYNPGATLDSESDSNEVMDHVGEPIPLPANPEPPAVPDEAIVPPVHTPSSTPPPRPPSPVGIGARLPMCNRQKPRQWWKLSPVQLDDPDQMEESDDELTMPASLPDEPLTFAEALPHPDAEKWDRLLWRMAVNRAEITGTRRCPLVQATTCWKCTKCCWAAQIRSRLESSVSN